MRNRKPITRGAGQAPRRYTGKRRGSRARTVAFYVFLTVAGIILFRAGAAYSNEQRGYIAVGGEVFALFLPLIYFCGSNLFRDPRSDERQYFRKGNGNESK